MTPSSENFAVLYKVALALVLAGLVIWATGQALRQASAEMSALEARVDAIERKVEKLEARVVRAEALARGCRARSD